MKLILACFTAVVLVICTMTVTVNADVLCIKKRVTVNDNGTINLGRSVRKVSGIACPAGTKLITDLAGLFNETGEQPVVASSKLLTGVFGTGGTATGAGEYVADSVSFPANFDGTITAEVVEQGAAATANCPGSAAAPDAAAGFLCIYVSFAANVNSHLVWDPLTNTDGTASPMGGSVYAYSTGAGAFYSWGTWAARAAAGVS